MPNNSITSLAILKANWDLRHFDYIDNFIPFFQNLIKIKDYTEIDIDTVRADFEKEYGLSIPFHPTVTILKRLKNKNIICKKENKFLVNKSEIQNSNFNLISEGQERKLNKVVNTLIDFGKSNQKTEFDKKSAETALLNFFRENGVSLLFATKEENPIPETFVNKSISYIVAKFIQNAKDSDPEIFTFLTDIAVGTALATSIVYGEHLKNSGGNKNLNLYFDTGYILALLGVNGKEKKQAFEELTLSLITGGAKTFIFEHTYDELMGILTSASNWINHGNYQIEKASRVLKYFIANDYTESDVDIFIAQIPAILEKYRIQKVSKPDYLKKIAYQIDEVKLKGLIINSYKNDPFFDEIQREETINKDIESIYSICKLREGKIPYTLKDASHIFITTNTSLAKISIQIQNSNGTHFFIPPLITDVFIGTLTWLQNPLKTKILNEKKLMADAFAAIQPDSQLIKKYIDEVNALKEKGDISDNEYFILRTNRVSFSLLSEKTKNDIANFKPQTASEILDEINKKHLAELSEKLKNQTILLNKKDAQIESSQKLIQKNENKNKDTNLKYQKAVNILVSFITWPILVLITFLIITALVINSFPTYFTDHPVLQKLIIIFLIIISILGLNIFNIKNWLSAKIKLILIKKILRRI